MRGIAGLLEDRLASQEGLCSMDIRGLSTFRTEKMDAAASPKTWYTSVGLYGCENHKFLSSSACDRRNEAKASYIPRLGTRCIWAATFSFQPHKMICDSSWIGRPVGPKGVSM